VWFIDDVSILIKNHQPAAAIKTVLQAKNQLFSASGMPQRYKVESK
jgi:hypothetical protein